jgi:allantoin racemase
MKIGIIVPNVGMSKEQLEERLTFLKGICNPDTEIEMIKNSEGPLSIESEFEHQEASVQIIKTIMKLKSQGYDAFIPWCGGDPGITSGREVTAVPVVGPFQSSCSIAILLGYKFSIITPSTNPRLIEERIHSLHLGDRLASIRMLNIPVLELRQDISKTINILKDMAQKMIQEDGADVIILSCLGLFGVPSQLMGLIQVPIIDPAWAAVKMAETIVTMGLKHNKIAYPYPKGMSF